MEKRSQMPAGFARDGLPNGDRPASSAVGVRTAAGGRRCDCQRDHWAPGGRCVSTTCREGEREVQETPQVYGLLYSQPLPDPCQSYQALLASPPAASGSDEAWLALEIDADACTAAPGGAGPGEIRAVTARGALGL